MIFLGESRFHARSTSLDHYEIEIHPLAWFKEGRQCMVRSAKEAALPKLENHIYPS